MGSAFHQLCPRYSGTLTPIAPTAIRLWDTFTFTLHTIYFFNIKKKTTLNYPKSAAKGFFSLGTQERVRNSRGKRDISVRATKVLLYMITFVKRR